MAKMKPKECQNVEYKQSWHDKYLEWICGFANAQGAVMYFGVNDDREVVGLKDVDRLLEDIPNKIVTTMGIVADVNLHETKGVDYIEVIIEPSNIPINYRGKYYYRSGSMMQELRGPALQQFILKKMGRSWDDIPNDFATIDDLDQAAIAYFLRKGYENGRISDEERNAPIDVVLENLNLVSENGKLKNAALLLFAKKPQRYFTCVQFKIGRFSHSESNLIIQDVIEGNIIQMADRVVDMLKSKYLTMPIRFEGMNRIEEFSKPRNRNIANAFFKAGFIDAWGRGYKKIREGFENVGLPMPVIETADGGVKVTFQRRNQGNPISDFGKDFGKELSERQLLILELIALDPSLSAKAISEKVSEKMSEKVSGKASITARTIENDMAKLKKLGILTHEGSRKEGRWIIVKTKLSK